jgi:hypothetical protein
MDMFHCGGCNSWYCGRSAKKIQNGPETVYCPTCRATSILHARPAADVPAFNGSSYIAERAQSPVNQALAASAVGVITNSFRKLLGRSS